MIYYQASAYGLNRMRPAKYLSRLAGCLLPILYVIPHLPSKADIGPAPLDLLARIAVIVVIVAFSHPNKETGHL